MLFDEASFDFGELQSKLEEGGASVKDAKRFAAKVKSGEGSCWIWQAAVERGGYGRFQFEGKNCYAHRWAFERLMGDPGGSLDHKCQNQACVNPAHLEVVTRAENTRRRHARGSRPIPTRAPGHKLFNVRAALAEGKLFQAAFDLLLANGVPEPDALRFATRVKHEGKCWRWIGKTSKEGYGTFTFLPINAKKHRIVKAHRWIYMRVHGDDSVKGLVVDHLCRAHDCVNPDHLEAVTIVENVQRGKYKEWNQGKTHCPQGHPYDEKNTAVRSGRRHCRACARARAARKHTHCLKGHEFTVKNTGFHDNNGKSRRYCLTCASKPQRRVEACRKGHPYDEANTWINPRNNGRHCLTCSRERSFAKKTACAAGHPYLEGSFEIVVSGRKCWRRCRVCTDTLVPRSVPSRDPPRKQRLQAKEQRAVTRDLFDDMA